MLELEISDAVMTGVVVGETAEIASTVGPVAGGALIGVGTVDSC